MVQIINPNSPIQQTGAPMDFGTGVGGTLEALGKAAFGDQVTPELKRRQIGLVTSKTVASDRENAGTSALAAALRSGTYTPETLAAEGINAGLSPAVVFGYNQGRTVLNKGAGSNDALDATMAVPGSSYGSTVQGKNAELENARTLQKMQEGTKLAIEAQKPQTVLVDGIPTIRRQDQSYGLPASVSAEEQKGALLRENFPKLDTLNPSQQKSIGAQPTGDDILNASMADGSTIPVRMGPNGPVNAQTGEKIVEPIQALGKLNATDAGGLQVKDPATKAVVDSRVATNTAISAIDRLKAGLTGPDAAASVGVIGKSASLLNGVRAQVEAGVKLAGGDAGPDPALGQAVTAAINNNPELIAKAQQLGINHAVLQSQISDLAYIIAKARDPGGRQSNQDVERAMHSIGGALGDPQAMAVVLDELKFGLQQGQAIKEQTIKDSYGAKAFPIPLNGHQPPAPSVTPAASPAAVQPPAAAAPVDKEGDTATGPGSAKLVFRNGQWGPQ